MVREEEGQSDGGPMAWRGDEATSNCTVSKAGTGAKEKMEERGSDLVWGDKERMAGGLRRHYWLAGAMAMNCNHQALQM